MAHIDVKAGALAPAPTPKAPREPRAAPKSHECAYCFGTGTKRRAGFVAYKGAMICSCCANFFGVGSIWGMPGCTNLSHAETVKKIEALRAAEYAMVLIGPRSFAAGDGASLTVELGDVMRVSVPPIDIGATACSARRTMDMFSVHVHLGRYPIRLFLHECSAIDFMTILKMRQDGSIEEAYAAADDDIGHFRATAQARADIDATFGSR